MSTCQKLKGLWLLVMAVRKQVHLKTEKSSGKRKAVTQKMTSKGIDLKSLPPTDECLELNIQRARFQLMLWDASLDGSPPNLDPCKVISFYHDLNYS